ncbi:MAG: prepilin-type N-terminal cleavage/methylation domain-containing protein [Lautropia sp.]|nr:prepilin-type N-terminal cleavage/methylation domain-containing protein [Lautropia sp.]
MRRTHPARGFTLIELLIAVGLLAILAVLSWRGLDTILQSRNRLVAESNGLRSLTIALAQLEDDLLQTWPIRNLSSNIRPIVVRQERNGGQELALVREVARRGEATRIQRIVYRVANGRLERGFSEQERQPGGSGVVGGAVQALIWQPILEDVRSMTLRGWVPARWLTGQQLERYTAANSGRGQNTLPPGVTNPLPEDAPNNPNAPVTGLEVLIERSDGQRFLRLYSVKD